MKKILDFVKKETVLSVALLLAVLSALAVPPDSRYLGYVDFRTLAILFSLMAVMAGMKALNVFDVLAQKLLRRVGTLRATVAILWGLCFFGSMLITNDVALITFVPFTIILLHMLGGESVQRWLIPVVAMQTVAANLGSMLTPIGNPQNLYLFELAGLNIGQFLLLMLPYTAPALLLLAVWTLVLCRKHGDRLTVSFDEEKQLGSTAKLCGYLALFILCLLTVAHAVHYVIPLAAVGVFLLVFDRKIFARVDYSLLLTFTGFFVFIGNMGRVEAFRSLLERIVSGHELAAAVLSSQVISNVPAALLLSGFTERYSALVVGTNLGGLGTLIASMASLISFKYIARENKAARLPYLLYFTAANLVFLAILIVPALLLKP